MDTVRITRSDDGFLLTVVAEGRYTIGEIKAAIEAATIDAPVGRDCCLLMDIRRSEALPSADDLRDFAQFLGDLPTDVVSRSAWLVSADVQFGLARMLSVYAEEKGITIQVFRDLDRARAWLQEGHEAGHVGDRSPSTLSGSI